jgi:hypothetical protein
MFARAVRGWDEGRRPRSSGLVSWCRGPATAYQAAGEMADNNLLPVLGLRRAAQCGR